MMDSTKEVDASRISDEVEMGQGEDPASFKKINESPVAADLIADAKIIQAGGSIEINPVKKDFSKLFDEIVKENKEAALKEFGFYISAGDILKDVSDEIFPILPIKISLSVAKQLGTSEPDSSKWSENLEYNLEEGESEMTQGIGEPSMKEQPNQNDNNVALAFAAEEDQSEDGTVQEKMKDSEEPTTSDQSIEIESDKNHQHKQLANEATHLDSAAEIATLVEFGIDPQTLPSSAVSPDDATFLQENHHRVV